MIPQSVHMKANKIYINYDVKVTQITTALWRSMMENQWTIGYVTHYKGTKKV